MSLPNPTKEHPAEDATLPDTSATETTDTQKPFSDDSKDSDVPTKSASLEIAAPVTTSMDTPSSLPKKPEVGKPSSGNTTPRDACTDQPSSIAPEKPPKGFLPSKAVQLASSHSVGTKRKREEHVAPGSQSKLEEQLKKQDMNSVRFWIMFLRQAEASGNIDAVTAAYDRAVGAFPYAADFWIKYIQTELEQGEFKKAEALFARCLTKVSRVKLWNSYLEYVLRTNNVQTGGDTARNVIMQSYEFALTHIGIDRDSGPIWAEYIDFIKTKQPQTIWEQQQQMDLVRKTYRRAVCIPLSNIETLWHAYNAFENGISKTTARKFLSEKSPAYMTARSASKEMAKLLDGLYRDGAPIYNRRRSPDVRDAQTRKWQAWLDWEKANPLGSDTKDLQVRVKYTYKQAATSLWFSPDVWFNAALYSLEAGAGTDGAEDDIEEGVELLKIGLEAVPLSFLLYYKLAEVYESHGKFGEAKDAYLGLINKLKERRESCEQSYKELEELEKEAVTSEEGSTTSSLLTKLNELNASRGSTPTRGETPQLPSTAFQPSAKLAKLKNQLDNTGKTLTHAYISYMKGVMRMEGITHARQIFSECRRASYATYHIYVASAMMESHDGRNDIAIKIFEIGAKRYESAEFIREYLSFLISNNDDTNARALFEKSIKKIDAAEAKILYQQFMHYEAEYGELSALLKLEKRYRVLYPEESALDMFMERWDIPSKSTKHAATALHNGMQSKGVRNRMGDWSNTRRYYDNGSGDDEEDDDEEEEDDGYNGPVNGGRLGGNGSMPQRRSHKKGRHEEGGSGSAGRNGGGYGAGNDGQGIPVNVVNVMKALPPANTFTLQPFDPSKMVTYFQNLQIPESMLR